MVLFSGRREEVQPLSDLSTLAAEKRILELIARGAPLIRVLESICLLYEDRAPGALCSAWLLSGNRLVPSAGPSLPAGFLGARADGVVGAGELGASWSRPIRAGNEVLGTFAVYHREERAASQAERELLDALADLAGVALERHRVLEALHASEDRYRALVDGLNEVIVQTDAGGKLTFVSSSFVGASGVPAAEVVGRALAEFVHPDDRPRLLEVERAVLAGERAAAHVELRMPTASGQRWIDWTVRARHGVGQAVVGLGGILTDVTERKLLEEQLLVADRMASMGTLVAGVAHEINNPLASVMLNLDFLGRELSNALLEPGGLVIDRLLDPLRSAAEAVERVRDLVRNLKVFSRGDDRRRIVDVRMVLESTMRMALSEVRHRARVARDFREVPPVTANEAELGQVFLNLIINAAQAIPDGHIDDHEIRLVTRSDAAGRAVVEVRDTGAGIAPEILPRIFDPFFTTKPVGVGTGLGLAICHRLVTAMGGEITVESEVGVGSVFRVLLPATEAAGEPRRKISQPFEALRRAHLLVVDDEPLIGEAVRRLVVPLHEVTTVTSSEDALAMIRGGERFDVILCDLMMPRMDGVQLHDAIARFDADLAERMLFITGGGFSASVRNFIEGMRHRVLEKPFDAKSLFRAVQERLR